MLLWMSFGFGALPQVLFLNVLVSQVKAGVTPCPHFTRKTRVGHSQGPPFERTKLGFVTHNALMSKEELGFSTHHAPNLEADSYDH